MRHILSELYNFSKITSFTLKCIYFDQDNFMVKYVRNYVSMNKHVRGVANCITMSFFSVSDESDTPVVHIQQGNTFKYFSKILFVPV